MAYGQQAHPSYSQIHEPASMDVGRPLVDRRVVEIEAIGRCAWSSLLPRAALLTHHPRLGRSFPCGPRARAQEPLRRPMLLTIRFPRERLIHPRAGGAESLSLS